MIERRSERDMGSAILFLLIDMMGEITAGHGCSKFRACCLAFTGIFAINKVFSA